MARIAALGGRNRIQGLALAGVVPLPAATVDEALVAWRGLPSDVGVLILTPQAAEALADHLDERRDLLVTVLP